MKITPPVILILIIFTCLCSCLRKDFDTPPDTGTYDPDIPVTHSIRELLQLPFNTEITDNIVISGIVAMDDRNGNYYKKLCLQDDEAGIELLIDQSSLYNDFPVGRKIYIKCKGLHLGNAYQHPQLGYPPDGNGNLDAIPSTEIENHIIKASFPHTIKADTFYDLSLLKNPDSAIQYLNKVIVVKDLQFLSGSEGIPYAQKPGIASATNRSLYDCKGNILSLRTSAYATFQSQLTPTGNGLLTGIYTRHNQAAQLYIRDTTDINFQNPRCDDTSFNRVLHITIQELRSMFEGNAVSLGEYRISGVVISDRTNGNIQQQNIVLQDNQHGIVLRFWGNPPTYALGDSLSINIANASLETYNGLLQVNGVRVNDVTRLGTGIITPRVVTIHQAAYQFADWESTLVKINDCVFTQSGIYSGTKTIRDNTGSMAHYTYTTAYFAGENLPQDTVNLTGIISRFNNTIQLQIRNTFDLE